VKVLNTPRQEIINVFRGAIGNENLSKVKKVLVLGGPLNEPELQVLREMGEYVFYFAGVEEIPDSNWINLDLNFLKTEIKEKFDFILCSQVIEHVWNTNSAFSNISSLLNRDGFAWVACPANNFPHGSPEYYAAGYSSEFLEVLAKFNNMEVLCSGTLSNPRVYLYRHLLNIWPTNFQLKFPLIAYFGIEGTRMKKFFWQFKTFICRMIIVTASPRYSHGVARPIETWIFCKKSK
jgi:SAM-dependent methyltransferase